MPWTRPDLRLPPKPTPLWTMRRLGRRHVEVFCANDKCQHQAELNADEWPDEVTFGDLQPRMLRLRPPRRRRPARLGQHERADAALNWDADFDDLPPIELPDGRKLETLTECAAYILELPKRQEEEPADVAMFGEPPAVGCHQSMGSGSRY